MKMLLCWRKPLERFCFTVRRAKKAVKVSYVDMPYVGFWHMPCMDAPYVCIEPWCSLPSRQGITENLEEQKNLYFTGSWQGVPDFLDHGNSLERV